MATVGIDRIEEDAYTRVVEGLLEQLNMGQGFQQLFDSVYDQLQGVVPYDRIGVALLEEPERILRLTSFRSDGEAVLKVGYGAHLEGSTLQCLLDTGQPRIINDLEDYLQKKPSSASTQMIVQEGMRSSLTLPLVAEGKPIGAMFFSCRRKDIYRAEHAALLKRLAGHIAISIEKARLIAELQRTNAELAEANQTKDRFLNLLQAEVDRRTEDLRRSEERYRLLVQLGRMVSSSLEVRQVFECAADQIHRLLGCDRVSLLLVTPGETTRHGFALEFVPQRRWHEIPDLPMVGSAVQWVMDRGVPRVARNLDADRRFPEDHRLHERGYRSYVYLPLACRQRGLGVVGIASQRREEPDRWDLVLMGELCDQLAIALDNAAAYGEIARLKTELQEQNIYLRQEIKTDHDFGNLDWQQPGHGPSAARGAAGCADGFHRSDSGGNGDRQGANCPCDPRSQPPAGPVDGQGQLRGTGRRVDHQ